MLDGFYQLPDSFLQDSHDEKTKIEYLKRNTVSREKNNVFSPKMLVGGAGDDSSNGLSVHAMSPGMEERPDHEGSRRAF
jgi:hypothetical protein